VVMSSLFSPYVDDDAVAMLRDGSVLPGANVAFRYMVETIRRIEELGKTPIIFSPTPQNGSNIGRCLAKAEQFGENAGYCDFDLTASEARQKKVYEFLQSVSDVSAVVWLHNEICSERNCRGSFDHTFIYRDWGHLAHEGSAYLGTHMNFHGLIRIARQPKLGTSRSR
jgi:SGNH domain-containing protein